MVGETCLPNLGPIGVGNETCLPNLGSIGVRPKEDSLGTILRPSWSLLRPSWGLLRPSWGLLGPSWGLLGSSCGHFGPLGLFWQRLAWLKLAPRQGEKQIFTILCFCRSSSLEAILGQAWGHLGASWGHLGDVMGPPWDLLGPSWAFLRPS